MKKIIATVLCLTITSPCLAAGRYYNYYPQPNPGAPYYRYDSRYDCHKDFHNEKKFSRTSKTTKTLGVVAGIAGVAMLISAITD